MEKGIRDAARGLLASAFLVAAPAAFADQSASGAAGTANAAGDRAADNTGQNRQLGEPTAEQQKNNRSDLEITRLIRRSLVTDKSLSLYAHNVKIVAQNGAVILKGPVRSDEEKQAVEKKAAEVAGAANVQSQLEVAPKK